LAERTTMETNNPGTQIQPYQEPTDFKKAAGERQAKQKAAVLEELRRMPIVEIACKKAGVGRTSYYRFRKADKNFAKEADAALEEGVALMNDMAETGLLQGIRNQEFPSIAFWLKHRHAKYSPKLEVTGTLKTDATLTPEQEQLIQKALRMAGIITPDSDKEKSL